MRPQGQHATWHVTEVYDGGTTVREGAVACMERRSTATGSLSPLLASRKQVSGRGSPRPWSNVETAMRPARARTGPKARFPDPGCPASLSTRVARQGVVTVV
eukprot:3564311-Rhodomonas_salina.2